MTRLTVSRAACLALALALGFAAGSNTLCAQDPDTRYRVQVAALAELETAAGEARRVHRLLEGSHSVYLFDAIPLHAVRVGDFASAHAARRVLLQLRSLGVSDAWLAKVRTDPPVAVFAAGEAIVERPPASRPPEPAPTRVEVERITGRESTAGRVLDAPLEAVIEAPPAEAVIELPPAIVPPPPNRPWRARTMAGAAERIEAPAVSAPKLLVDGPTPPIDATPSVSPAVDAPEPEARDETPGPEPRGETPVADAALPRVPALVEQIAGATLYLDAGTDVGIGTGDTVTVARDSLGSAVGSLVVVRSTGSRSVLTFADDPFPLTRGQTLFVTPLRVAVDQAERAGPESVATRPERGEREASGSQSSGTGPVARGRISLDLDATRSSARYGSEDDQAVDRVFATPSLRFRTRVTNLPGDLQLNANTRLAYRYTDSPFPSTPTSVRVYELSVAKSFRNAPLEFRAGRFYNPYESYSGYWDGLLARVGTRTAGVGVALGFQPNRWNQGVSTDLPKLSVFGDARLRSGRTRYEIDVSAHRVQPNNGLFRHTFFGLSQHLRVGAVRLSQNLQVDENPIEGGWDVTRLQLNAGVDVHEKVHVRANISRHRPYRLWDTLTVISYPRDQAGAGLTVRAAGGTVGADVAVNRDLDEQIGHSYSSFFRFPRGPFGFGFNGSARYWDGAGYRVLSLSPGLSRSFGAARAQLSYRFYRSEYEEREFLTHTVEGGLSLFVGRGLRYSIRASSQWSADLFSNRVYTGLSKNF